MQLPREEQVVVARVAQPGREAVAREVVGQRVVHAHRHEGVRDERHQGAAESPRRDADDRKRAVVDRHRLAEDPGAAAEVLPQLIADDDDRHVGAGPLLVCREAAAQHRRGAERGEEVLGDDVHEQPAGGVSFAHADHGEVVSRERGEHVPPLPQVVEVREGKCAVGIGLGGVPA